MLRYREGAVFQLREGRRAGRSPSALLRALRAAEPRASGAEIEGMLGDAFGLGTDFRAASLEDPRRDADLDSSLEARLGVPAEKEGLLVGAVLGDARYRVERAFGGTSSGGVFCGRDVSSGGRVLITAARPQRAPLPEVARRLESGDPRVPALRWLGPYAPGHVLIEDAPGESLRESWIGAQPAERVLAVLSEIASVARAFHAEGRTLQGLRPETLGRSEGRLWLTPRWLAFLTGAEPGPPGPAPFAVIYTAPELFEQRRLGPAADVFTLAVLACEWLSGRHPFAAQGPLHRLAVLAAKPTFLPPGFPAGPFERDPMRRPRLDVWLGQLARSVS